MEMPPETDTKFSDDFWRGPIALSELAPVLKPYLDQIDQCLAGFGAALGGELDQERACLLSGVTSENWSSIMDRLNNQLKIADRVARLPEVRQAVEHHVGANLKPFQINKIRINHPDVGKSSYGWHQDAATWPGLVERYEQLKSANILTLWLCITSSTPENGIELAVSGYEKTILDHSFVDNQGYFFAKPPASLTDQDYRLVYGSPLTGALFGQNVLHRTLVGGAPRLSMDLRYFSVG